MGGSSSSMGNSNVGSNLGTNGSSSYPSTPASKTEASKVEMPSSMAPTLMTPSVTSQPVSGMSNEAAALFRKNRSALQALFDTYATGDMVSLEQFFSMCSDFDLFPTFVNRDGVVTCFGKTTQTGYENYINALYELAEHALGKPTFEPLYPTSQAKVDVMLNLWGLADTSRLTQINSKRNV